MLLVFVALARESLSNSRRQRVFRATKLVRTPSLLELGWQLALLHFPSFTRLVGELCGADRSARCCVPTVAVQKYPRCLFQVATIRPCCISTSDKHDILSMAAMQLVFSVRMCSPNQLVV